jgi:cation diffusion facilitator family transporter
MTDKAPMRQCIHTEAFHETNPLAEQRMRWVVAITAAMMVTELTAGWMFNSMALLADGWHMSSHVVALGISAAAYAFARRLSHDRRFAFGTWKIEVLGGYSSAILLMGVAVYMVVESCIRIFDPVRIEFNQAIGIATLGLAVNVLSTWLLSGASQHHGHDHHSHHDHNHDHDQGEHHHDLNLRSAYVHVAADAATSVLAIAALVGGKYWGATWLDPAMGLIGAVVVAAWAVTLLRNSAKILLDAEMDAPVVAEIRQVVARNSTGAEILDLHVWRVGKAKFACVLNIASGARESPNDLRALLTMHKEVAHVTIEISHVRG